MKSYILRVLVALDVFIMTLLFNGKRGETLSSAAYSLEKDKHIFGVFRVVIDFIFRPVEYNHCFLSWSKENESKYELDK